LATNAGVNVPVGVLVAVNTPKYHVLTGTTLTGVIDVGTAVGVWERFG